MRRDGVNRRQVPQLKKALKAGGSVSRIAAMFNVEPIVVFNFAKGWDIKLKETPESVALKAHEGVIEAEVSRRMNERLALGGKPNVFIKPEKKK